MIEINETEPVEASLTIVLRGPTVEIFKDLLDHINNGWSFDPGHRDLVRGIWRNLS